MVVVGSIFERRAAGLYHNTAVVIDSDGSLRGRYRKMHIPGRPALLREVLFHARRPRFSGLRHRRMPESGRSSAGTSGIPKPPG